MPDVRAVRWFTTISQDQALSDGGQLTFNLLSGMASTQFRGSTITRTVLTINTRADTIGATKHTWWGMVLVNADAVTAGAFPDADVETDRADWMIRGLITTGAPALASEFGALGMLKMDLRSQRVIRGESTELRLIFDDLGAAAGGVFVTLLARVLVKLP